MLIFFRKETQSRLVSRNYEVLPAGSIAHARELAAQETIDFLIVDIGLPDGNGNELMKELRERFGLKGVALTGYGTEEDIQENLAAGIVAYLTKPIRIDSLENILADSSLACR